MKAPDWFRAHVASLGGSVLKNAVTDEEAADALTDQTFTKDDGRFARHIVRDYARRQLKNWVASHRRVAVESDDPGQLDLFPEIPRKIEVAPGRFVAQGFMTRKDWFAAVKQAETKASNASGHAEAIKQTADKVVPLLTTDDQTTGEVWAAAGLGRVIEGGAL